MKFEFTPENKMKTTVSVSEGELLKIISQKLGHTLDRSGKTVRKGFVINYISNEEELPQ